MQDKVATPPLLLELVIHLKKVPLLDSSYARPLSASWLTVQFLDNKLQQDVQQLHSTGGSLLPQSASIFANNVVLLQNTKEPVRLLAKRFTLVVNKESNSAVL
jgi:hypothetical protein